MKKILFMIVCSIVLFASIAQAQVQVKGYYKKNGTYVQPHTRTSPDGVKWNNKSYNGH